MKNFKIKVDRVMQVYSGKLGCMCGCNGNYRVASQHVAVANLDRGYDHDPKDVNDRQVRKVVQILERQAAEAGVTFDEKARLQDGKVLVTDAYVAAEIRTGAGPSGYRSYCAYFVPPKAELDAVVARRAERKVKAAIAAADAVEAAGGDVEAKNRAFFTKLGF